MAEKLYRPTLLEIIKNMREKNFREEIILEEVEKELNRLASKGEPCSPSLAKEILCVNCNQPMSSCDCGGWEPDYTINMHGEKIPNGCKLGFYCNHPKCHCEHGQQASCSPLSADLFAIILTSVGVELTAYKINTGKITDEDDDYLTDAITKRLDKQLSSLLTQRDEMIKTLSEFVSEVAKGQQGELKGSFIIRVMIKAKQLLSRGK